MKFLANQEEIERKFEMALFSCGSEGSCFDLQCSRCKYGEKPCPIALVQQLYNVDAFGNDTATEILDCLVHQDGSCQMFEMCKEDFELKDDEYKQLNLFDK